MSANDPTTGLSLLAKYVDTDRLYDIPFSQELRTGDTIFSLAGVTATAQGDATEVAALAIAANPAFDDDTVQPRISAGTSGERYRIAAKAVTAAGDTLEVDVMLKVL